MSEKFWLMKSEPDVYSIDHLFKDGSTLWEGVRNYQARNFMMKDMMIGDLVLFYHSNTEPPGVAGIGKISTKPIPDPTQFQKKSKYYDEKSSLDNPRWFCVRVEFVQKFQKFISLNDLKKNPNLKSMLVIKKGQRLSIQPVKVDEFNEIKKIGNSTKA